MTKHQTKGANQTEHKADRRSEATAKNRRLSVVVFALFFSWLLAFLFEGRVLYAITDYYSVSASSYVFGAMLVQFAGLVSCGFFVKTMRSARRLLLVSIAFCVAASFVFFTPPSFLWTVAIMAAAFLVGACVASWGFYFKGFTPKSERIKTIADCLIFSNVLMMLPNMTLVLFSPQAGLGLSILILAAAFPFALLLPKDEAPEARRIAAAMPQKAPVSAKEKARVSIAGPLVFLCLFVVVITINSGLMYQVVGPAFAHLETLTSWYWVLPYIAALFVMRNLPYKANRAYMLYVAIAMIGFSFIAFLLMGRSWADYLVINTLMLGAFGIYDLFWWSILGEMLELVKNPAKILGIGLAANVLGVFFGGLIGGTVTQPAGHGYIPTLLALGVVCVTLVLLPPLHKRLIGLLKSHIYLGALAELQPQEQTKLIMRLNLTEKLTESENRVMLLLIKGTTYKAIANELYVSENTVKSHVKNIYSKAGVTSKAELANLILGSSNN